MAATEAEGACRDGDAGHRARTMRSGRQRHSSKLERTGRCWRCWRCLALLGPPLGAKLDGRDGGCSDAALVLRLHFG